MNIPFQFRPRSRRGLIIIGCAVAIQLLVLFSLYDDYVFEKTGLKTGSVNESLGPSQTEEAADSIEKFNDAQYRTPIENNTLEFLEQRYKEVIDGDEFNNDWQMFTPLHFRESVINPHSYKNERKKFHKYDPRITESVYLHYISKHASEFDEIKIPFSWQDWVDLSALNEFLQYDKSQRPTCEDIIDHGIHYNPLDAVREPNHKIHEEFCVDDINYKGHVKPNLQPGFSITNNAGENFNFLEKRIQARSFLLSTFEQPEKLVFLDDEGQYFEISVDHDRKDTMMENGLYDDFVNSKFEPVESKKENKNIKFNPLDELNKMKKNYEATVPPINFKDILGPENEYTLDIPKERFRYNPEEILQDLKNNYSNLTRAQKVFTENLEHAIGLDMNTIPKSFDEARMHNHDINGHSVANAGHHFDLKFFNGFISESKINYHDNLDYKVKMILHHMLHTWLQFSFNAGVISFPAHGSLLSWYWDGMIFPWDNDIDVILPIQDLNDLCMNFNNSLIIQSSTDGFSKFFLDCSKSITVRENGNGNNNIDARFIDVDSGMYIDLTGLTVTGQDGMSDSQREHLGLKKIEGDDSEKRNKLFELHDNADIYNCRNKHFYPHDELSPMRFTLMEHGPAFVPSNIEEALTSEYSAKSLVTINYNYHIFIEEFQLWLPLSPIARAAKQINTTTEIDRSELGLRAFYLDHRNEVAQNLLDDEEIVIELFQSWSQARYHKVEMDIWKRLKSSTLETYPSVLQEWDDLMQSFVKYHNPMRKAKWDYYLEVQLLNLEIDLDFKEGEMVHDNF
ncbi:hypothetical protein DAMA08_014720 [Martiniozyma asiatica (nom. inval.)]|nr:hypothetical protein DAMA08_014720 [Martiniozyma asiatica]